MDKEQKTIELTEANNTPSGIEVINTPDAFLWKLETNNIKDLTSDKVDIGQDGNRYIFSIDGKPSFSVVGKNNFEAFVNAFYDNAETAEIKAVAKLNGLKLEVLFGNDPKISQYEAELKEHREQANDPYITQQRIDRLQEFFENQIDATRRNTFWATSSYPKQQREYRRTHREEAKKRLKSLKRLEKELNKINQGLSEYSDTNAYQQDLELKTIAEELDKLSDQVPNFVSTKMDIITGKADISPSYGLEINSKKDAKKLLKSLEKYNKELKKITEKTQDVAQAKFSAQDLDSLQKYLNDVVNNKIDPATIPWTAAHKAAFNELVKLDASLKDTFPMLSTKEIEKAGTLSGNQDNITQQNTGNTTTPNNQSGTDNLGNNPQNNNETTNNGSFNEAVKNGGLYGGLNHLTEGFQDQSQRGQNFYKSFGNVALLAGGIFLGVKALGATWRLIRGKKKEGDRGWVAGTAGLLLATAGRPQDIFKGGYSSEKIAGLLSWIGIGNKKEGNNESGNGGNMENSSNTVTNSPQETLKAATGAMTLFNGMTYAQMKDRLEEDSDGKIKIKGTIYNKRLSEAKQTKTSPIASADRKANAAAQEAFLEKIGEDDENGIINLALTSMGISWETLTNSDNANNKFNTSVENYIQKAIELGDFMDTKNYEQTNGELQNSIQEYMKGDKTLEQLESEGVFEKKVNIPDEVKASIKTQIDALDISDSKKKQIFKDAVHQFYYNWNSSEKDLFKIEKGTNEQIIMSTYKEKTPITLDRKLSGLAIQYPTTKETLRVANLTNRIKDLSREKQPANNDETPFRLDETNRITFNDTAIYDLLHQDTTLISKSGLESVSKKLSSKENKEKYINYLNDRWKNKSNINYVPAAVAATVGGSTIEDQGTPNQSNETQKLDEEKKKMEKLNKEIDNEIISLKRQINSSDLLSSDEKKALLDKINIQEKEKNGQNANTVSTITLEKVKKELEIIKTNFYELVVEKSKPISEEKINKELIPTLLHDVFNYERKKKNNITFATIQNPYLKISFDPVSYNSYSGGTGGVSYPTETYAHYYSINLNQIFKNGKIDKPTLDDLVNEKKAERKKTMEINQTARHCLQQIKTKEYTINDLFKNYDAINHPGHTAFFRKFDDNTLVFDKADTKQKADGSKELLLTFDDKWGNEDYNEDISINLEDITENGQFIERKLKEQLQKIINNIVEQNFSI